MDLLIVGGLISNNKGEASEVPTAIVCARISAENKEDKGILLERFLE